MIFDSLMPLLSKVVYHISDNSFLGTCLRTSVDPFELMSGWGNVERDVIDEVLLRVVLSDDY